MLIDHLLKRTLMSPQFVFLFWFGFGWVVWGFFEREDRPCRALLTAGQGSQLWIKVNLSDWVSSISQGILNISPPWYLLLVRSASWYETYLYCWTSCLKMLACSCQFCWVERHYHHERDDKTSVVLVKCKWKVETTLPLRDHSVKWQNREKLWSRGISILQLRDRCVGLPRFIKQISARIKHECPYSRRHQN